MDYQRLHHIILVGQIHQISDDGLLARVRIGDILTDYLPLPAFYGANFTANLPMHKHAHVVLACPSGDLENAIIIQILWSQAITPYTSEQTLDGVQFSDGTVIAYDSEAQQLELHTPGQLIISAAEIKLNAATISLEGPVTQSGGDITSDGISLQNHKHPETNSITEKPQ